MNVTMSIEIRQAVESDAEQILQIYKLIVESTAISFEMQTPSIDEISYRIRSALKTHEWLVAVDSEGVAGYAYASQYRAREAYRFSAETTVYVKEKCRGAGVGKNLYETLFQSLKVKGFRRAFAGIALPNEGSIALHKASGFTEVGVFLEAGLKFDRWHDVSWWQRRV